MHRVFLVLFLVTGCASIDATSQYMTAIDEPMRQPPPGKALVVIHKKLVYSGIRPMYAKVWDSQKFVADLGSGHACYYVCDPGRHVMISHYPSGVGVVDSELLPGHVYDYFIDRKDGGWEWLHIIEPVLSESMRKLVPQWTEEMRPLVPNRETGAAYEAQHKANIGQILKDFVGGPKSERLKKMGPNDFRR